jgi:ribosome maturation factor RimP
MHPKVGPVGARFLFFGAQVGRKEEVLEKVRQIASPLAAQEGLELVDAEFGGPGGRQTLRLYIDKEGGVSLDDCSSLSHAVSAALDVEDPIIGAYDLEVSSPGLDRPLRTAEHFQKYAGERVRVKTYAPISPTDNRKTFVGKLNGYEEGFVIVDVDGTVFRVPHAQISKANVEPDFDN